MKLKQFANATMGVKYSATGIPFIVGLKLHFYTQLQGANQ